MIGAGKKYAKLYGNYMIHIFMLSEGVLFVSMLISFSPGVYNIPITIF